MQFNYLSHAKKRQKQQKERKKTDNAESKTISHQCSASPRLLLPSFLSFPAWFLCLPIHGWCLTRERGEGREVQAARSICITAAASAWLDWCSGRLGPAPRAKSALAWLPNSNARKWVSACVFGRRKSESWEERTESWTVTKAVNKERGEQRGEKRAMLWSSWP